MLSSLVVNRKNKEYNKNSFILFGFFCLEDRLGTLNINT
jgi:hypothetical protein